MRKSLFFGVLGAFSLLSGLTWGQANLGACDPNAGPRCEDTATLCMWVGNGRVTSCNNQPTPFTAVIIGGKSPGSCQWKGPSCIIKGWPCTTNFYNAPQPIPPAGPICNNLNLVPCPATAINQGC